MINAGVSLVRVVTVALGLTLVLWTYALIQSRSAEESFDHFFRMFVGFVLLTAMLEVMYL